MQKNATHKPFVLKQVQTESILNDKNMVKLLRNLAKDFEKTKNNMKTKQPGMMCGGPCVPRALTMLRSLRFNLASSSAIIAVV